MYIQAMQMDSVCYIYMCAYMYYIIYNIVIYNVIIIETKAYMQKIYRNRDNYEVREKYTIFKESK